MRQYKDSGIEWIGKIPETWEVLPHKRIMRKIKEICFNYNGEDIISLTTNGVIVRDLSAGGKMPTTFDGYQYVHPGNLLMCLFDIDVTPRCIGLIKDEGLTSPAYSQFKFLRSEAYAPYFDYLLRYMDDEKCLLHLSKNLRSSLTEEDFGIIYTVLPPLSEQQHIVKYLDTMCGEIDSLIAQQEQMIEKLKAYKQSVITEAVTKGLDPNAKLVPSGIDWIGEIPVGWKVCKLKNQYTLLNGRAYSDSELLQEGKYRILRVGNLFSSDKWYYSDMELEDNKYCKENDLLYGWSASIGPLIWKGEKVIYHYHIWKVLFYGNDLRFSYYLLDALTHAKKRDMHGSAMQHLTKTNMDNSWIPLIPKEVQHSIATYLDTKCSDIDRLIALKQQKIEALKEYKKSVIYEAVTGKTEIV